MVLTDEDGIDAIKSRRINRNPARRSCCAKRVWRYQRGNQNPYIEEEQRATKHAYKAKDRVTRTLLISVGELRCSGRVRSSCSTSDTRRVNLVTNPVISHERGKDREV